MDAFVIIAHRGASGYLPEHTLEAKALAAGLGADALEQDVVMSRDGQLVVLHDIHLEEVTDVAERFPARARGDGRFYAIDFDWAELAQLRVWERFDPATGKPVYPGRFPGKTGSFRLHTLGEELALVRGLEKARGKTIGVYPEFKAPAWHETEGRDLGAALLAELARWGYRERTDPCRVQCFDAAALRKLRAAGTRLRLVQLIGDNSWGDGPTDFEALRTEAGLAAVAAYADGIGPWWPFCLQGEGKSPGPGAKPRPGQLTVWAHQLGLEVHPFTFRADDWPREWFGSYGDMVRFFQEEVGVDGVFTDHPDTTREALK